MKPPQNGCFRLVRLKKDRYQNNIYSRKALMFQRSTPSSHICKIKWKNIFQLHQVLHFTQAKKSVAYRGYGRRIRRKTNVCSLLLMQNRSLWGAIQGFNWMQHSRTHQSLDTSLIPPHSLHCCLYLHLCFFPQLIYVSLAWLLPHSVFYCWHYWPFWVVTNNWTISITIY